MGRLFLGYGMFHMAGLIIAFTADLNDLNYLEMDLLCAPLV